MQSIKLLKVQAKEREAAAKYEEELEKIIERAERVDKTTKEYTEEQSKTISLIDEKDVQLKKSAEAFECKREGLRYSRDAASGGGGCEDRAD